MACSLSKNVCLGPANTIRWIGCVCDIKGRFLFKSPHNSFCLTVYLRFIENHLLYKMASAKGLHLTLVVFNAFLCFTSILMNIITIQALRKTSSLPKTLKTLLLSLAVSDLGVGLLVQPLYVATLAIKIDQNMEGNTGQKWN